MNVNIEFFERRLRERGFRVTAERRAVLNGIARHHGHFQVEGLVDHLRAGGARVSRATVYRTVTCLVDAGLLRKYDLGDRLTHYEPAVGKEHHEHMICVMCGRILEFVEERIERLQDDVCRRHRFRPLSHTLQIHGLCEDCEDARERPNDRTDAASDDPVPQVLRRQAMRG